MEENQSGFINGLIQAWHIVEFGVLGIVCCAGIITAGAATTAMFRMFFKMRHGEQVSFVEYFNAFGDVFKISTLIELIQLASGTLLGAMAYITLRASSISSMGIVLMAPVSLLFLIWVLVFAYAYAHEAYFTMDVKSTIKNCFTMTFGCLLCTTGLLILTLILPMLYLLIPDAFLAMLPIWIILLIPLINWWNSYFYIKAFEDYAKEHKKQIADEASDEAS